MSEYTYEVERLPGERFFIVLESIDYEVRLYWQNRVELSRRLIARPTRPWELKCRRKYVLRYNNNDSGSGMLRFRVYRSAQGQETTVLAVSDDAIVGPKVVEIPFLLRSVAGVPHG